MMGTGNDQNHEKWKSKKPRGKKVGRLLAWAGLYQKRAKAIPENSQGSKLRLMNNQKEEGPEKGPDRRARAGGDKTFLRGNRGRE